MASSVAGELQSLKASHSQNMQDSTESMCCCWYQLMCHRPLIRFDTSSVSVWLAMAEAAKSETLAWGRMGRLP